MGIKQLVIPLFASFALMGINTICSFVFFPYAAEAILLGFQHYLVMLGTTVLIPSFLVPQMGGGFVRLK